MSSRAASPSRARAAPRPRLTRRAAGLAAVVALLATASVVPLRQYAEQRGELAELEREVAELRAERDRLEAEVERLQDPEFLERLARECLGMVRPGEIAIVPVPKKGEPPPDRC